MQTHQQDASPGPSAEPSPPASILSSLLERLDRLESLDPEAVLGGLVRFVGLTKRTPADRIRRAIGEELVDLASRIVAAVTDGSFDEGTRTRVLQTIALSGRDADPTRFVFPRVALADIASAAAPAEAAVIQVYLDKHTAFEARVAWLVGGTSDRELAALDPLADCDRIYHRVASLFRVESRVLETLAINRIAQSTDVGAFFRTTRKAEDEPIGRFQDTYGLLSNYFEWGEDSARGREALARMKAIHGRYYIPNAGMKYVLLQTAFTWLDGAERIAHRPLHDIERRGFFHAFARLGRGMEIAEVNDDYDEMYGWYRAFNHANRSFHPSKRETFDRIVNGSFAAIELPHLRAGLHLALRAGMDETYREAVGYPDLTPDERKGLRAVMFTLGQTLEALPRPPFIRSLQNNPARKEYTRPGELGAGDRSPWMPRIDPEAKNGGFPDGLRPITTAEQTRPGELPEVSWDEIRRHASKDSLWVVLDGYVYDLTMFSQAHPGGSQILLAHAGKDATAAFRRATHSPVTEVFRENFRIAKVQA